MNISQFASRFPSGGRRDCEAIGNYVLAGPIVYAVDKRSEANRRKISECAAFHLWDRLEETFRSERCAPCEKSGLAPTVVGVQEPRKAFSTSSWTSRKELIPRIIVGLDNTKIKTTLKLTER